MERRPMVTSALRFRVCSWTKIVGTGAGVCRHTSQTMTLFMHALTLIVTQPSPPHPSLLLALLLVHPCALSLQMKN